MDRLERCREGLDSVRQMLATERLLTPDQLAKATTLLSTCEREASGYGNVLLELRAAHLKLVRCEAKGEFLDFLEAQYRARGLSSPRKIAMLVVLEEAINALKRATVATMEQMRRMPAA